MAQPFPAPELRAKIRGKQKNNKLNILWPKNLGRPFLAIPFGSLRGNNTAIPSLRQDLEKVYAMWGGGGWISNWAAKVVSQEPRKGGFSKGGFCRIQCHDQEISGPQKGPAERGHVKKRQKSSKSVKSFDTFRQFSRRAKNVKNGQKASKSLSMLFDNFRAGQNIAALLGALIFAFFPRK